MSFALLAVLVGLVAGLGAVVFRGLIALFHNLLFLGSFSFSYNANVHTPASPWGPFIILIPVLGALGVAFLVKNFAPEAKGHGVPEVMDAIYYTKGVIRPIVAAVKSVASALSIGSGGSIGREGPIIQIGSSFGSSVGQFLRLPPWQTITLIAAGAGGGIAATFNTPIGGVLFAIEIMMHEVSVKTLVPVAISTAMATYIGRLFFGTHPSFVIPQFEMPYFHLTHPLIIIAYVGLGVIMGVVAALFIKSIYGMEDFFDKRIPGNYYTRHLLGMLLVGVIIYLLMITTGHYYIEGVGYATVQDVLSSAQSSLSLLAILFVLKLLTTSLTLGSGASGGIFSPALYMGATLGGAYGIVLDHIFPGLGISPPAFAVAGMAGLVGGATGAAMTAIVMIFEMTLDYGVVIPMTITVAISYGIRKVLSKESIYTLKNVRRGHYMPEALQANMQFMRRVKDVMEKRFTIMSADSTLEQFVGILSQQPTVSNFLIVEGGRIAGVIRKYAVMGAIGQLDRTTTLGEIARRDYLIMTTETTLYDAIRKMRSDQASIILVTSQEGTVAPEAVQGMITTEEITSSIAEDADLFSD
ncbi:MAG TPA: chloride channel protein [Candidatus Fraserbacteria bacterium]|nr:chloride channel protein [Candidatus Fraserbacteria bacterium]